MGGRCDGKSFLMGRQLPPIAPPLLRRNAFVQRVIFLNFCLCYFLLCCLCRYDHPLSIIVLCFAWCPYSSLFRFAWLHFVERVLWNVFGLAFLVFHFIVVVADIMLAHLSQNGCEYKSQQPVLRHCGCCNPSPGMWAVRDSRSKMSKQSLVKKTKTKKGWMCQLYSHVCAEPHSAACKKLFTAVTNDHSRAFAAQAPWQQ